MSYETKALNKIATALGGSSRVQKNEILNEIAGNVDGLAGVAIYICSNGEYDTETGLPTVADKDEKTIYLTPTGEDVPNMYNEYIWKGDAWELFGSSSGGIKNLVDGSSAGSIRSINSKAEGSSYTMGENAFTEGRGTKASGLNSHAEGSTTTASGHDSHAEGSTTTASGDRSHAEGMTTNASGNFSHAEGNSTTASGLDSHAEGWKTKATSNQAHAEGTSTTASGVNSHAEGEITIAYGLRSHAEGYGTAAYGANQHVFGKCNLVDSNGEYVEIVGNGTGESTKSNARTLDWSGNEWLAGKLTVGAAPTADMDVATKKYVDDNAGGGGVTNLVDGSAAGSVRGVEAAAESDSYTMGLNAFAEGKSTKASGKYSHAEGFETEAKGDFSHAEGEGTLSEASHSHAEGYYTKAKGLYSHAEGSSSTASARSSHAEGTQTTASGNESHAEGLVTTASGNNSHAEGNVTSAAGVCSHAEGEGTSAKFRCQHVFGSHNVEDPKTDIAASKKGTYVEIVGNGTGVSAKSNARTLDWSGNEQLAGSLTLGMGTADEVTITAAQLKQLLATLS